jgi:Rps23 Pro-64 3,4-dihydroxylase Tpa1-like proline 4-hydroxylase
LISYVYYFHGTPKRFAGGGLLLYDSAVAADRYDQRAFTRIEPNDNSLVMFPSTAAHEVERVAVESGAMADGRFSVNGWFLEDDG